MEWKSVDEQLPLIKRDSVLFVYDNCNKIGYGPYSVKIKDDHRFYDNITEENVIASHWLPIPTLPDCDELD